MNFSFTIRPALLLGLFIFIGCLPALRADSWQVFSDSEFISDKYHDGDSFSVRTRKENATRSYTYIFRLYGVDSPESNLTQEPARVTDQAHYFGITPNEVTQWGRAAEEFTAKTLQEAKSITVITRKTDAGGKSRKNRYYAFIEVDGRDLAELLVEKGFARAYGKYEDYGKRSADEYQRLLNRKESAARTARVGAWSGSSTSR